MALPSLEILANENPRETAQYFIGTGLFFGINPDWFFPDASGRDYKLPSLLGSLESHREDFTIFSHLDHPGVRTGHDATHSFLSGVTYKNAASMPDGNLSLDQRIAEVAGRETRFPSLQFGVGSQRSSYLSWSRDAIALQPLTAVTEIYEQLFLQPNAKEKEATKSRLQRGQSILDIVRSDADTFQKTLGREDQSKLDEYFTSVRSVEKRIARSRDWQAKPRPQVDYRPPSVDTFAETVPAIYDLITLAFETDSTRSITFDICDFAGPSGLAGVENGYHTLTHHGKSEGRLEQLRIIEKFHVDQFARFLGKLGTKTTADGARLLDRTVALFGSGLGNANSHSNRNLPILLAGGGFAHGQHRILEETKTEPVPACNLYTSILQQFGIEDDRFGTSTGTLADFS